MFWNRMAEKTRLYTSEISFVRLDRGIDAITAKKCMKSKCETNQPKNYSRNKQLTTAVA